MIKVWKFLSVSIVLGVCLGLMLVPAVPAVPAVPIASADGGLTIEIRPQETKVVFNEPFQVEVWINTTDTDWNAMDFYVAYNTTYVNATAYCDSCQCSFEIPLDWNKNNSWNATHGMLHYACLHPGNYFSASQKIATVNFTSRSATGITGLDFIWLPGEEATMVSNGTDVLINGTINWDKAVGGTVKIGTTLTVDVSPALKGDVKVNTVTPGSYPYNLSCAWDAVVNLTAVNSVPGWTFANWSGDLSGPDNSTTITMNETTKSVTAHFTGVEPEISVSPPTLSWTILPDATDSTNYTITNSGGGILSWNSSNVTYDPDGNMTWLTQDISNGTLGPGEHDTVLVTFNSTNMTPGSYDATINITGSSSKELPVTLIVGVPAISASPTSLTFTTNEGEDPPDQTLGVCNSGTGILDWSLSDNVDWLSVAPTSGSLAEDDCEPVTVSVDVSGMGAGDYSATITINGSDEVLVPVSLHIVSAMPVIPVGPAELSASSLDISPQQVEPGQEVTISVNVANTGGETGSYNAVLYINGVVEDSQSVSVAAGTSKNVIFTVSKSKAGVYDVLLAGQSGQFEVVGGGGWFGAGGLGTGGIIAIVVVVIVLIVAVVFILRGTRRPE